MIASAALKSSSDDPDDLPLLINSAGGQRLSKGFGFNIEIFQLEEFGVNPQRWVGASKHIKLEYPGVKNDGVQPTNNENAFEGLATSWFLPYMEVSYLGMKAREKTTDHDMTTQGDPMCKFLGFGLADVICCKRAPLNNMLTEPCVYRFVNNLCPFDQITPIDYGIVRYKLPPKGKGKVETGDTVQETPESSNVGSSSGDFPKTGASKKDSQAKRHHNSSDEEEEGLAEPPRKKGSKKPEGSNKPKGSKKPEGSEKPKKSKKQVDESTDLLHPDDRSENEQLSTKITVKNVPNLSAVTKPAVPSSDQAMSDDDEIKDRESSKKSTNISEMDVDTDNEPAKLFTPPPHIEESSPGKKPKKGPRKELKKSRESPKNKPNLPNVSSSKGGNKGGKNTKDTKRHSGRSRSPRPSNQFIHREAQLSGEDSGDELEDSENSEDERFIDRSSEIENEDDDSHGFHLDPFAAKNRNNLEAEGDNMKKYADKYKKKPPNAPKAPSKQESSTPVSLPKTQRKPRQTKK